MLTPELLKKSEKLASLTEEQISEIAELSRNDEKAVLDKTVGELHGRYDADILEVTGKQKPSGVKTYDFLKNLLSDTLKEKSELEEQLSKAGGADEATKKKMADKDNDIKALRDQLVAKEQEIAKKDAEIKTRENRVRIEMHIDNVLNTLKFKDTIPESIIGDSKARAKEELLKMADVEDDGSIIFRDAEGVKMTNQSKRLEPITAADLIAERFKGAIEVPRIVTGAGTEPQPAKQSAGTIDISMAKTQVEADEIIINKLMQDGYARGTREFDDKLGAERVAAGVPQLPFK